MAMRSLPTSSRCCARRCRPVTSSGDIGICDNLASHKVSGGRKAIEACGAFLLYLPPYSPDPNPIELAFSKPKRLLRSAAARTVDAPWSEIAQLLQQFTPTEFAKYLCHCGYTFSGR